MKKILSKIGSFFGTVFALIFALIFGVCVVFYLPIDYIKYKRSHYYKTERKKYRLFAATGMHFELYNLIAKYNLPIKYVKNPKDDSLNCGWFVFGDTLLIIDDCGFVTLWVTRSVLSTKKRMANGYILHIFMMTMKTENVLKNRF